MIPHQIKLHPKIAQVKKHIESFPRPDSHNYRKDTNKEHLDLRLSLTKKYSLYIEECKKTIQEQVCTFM